MGWISSSCIFLGFLGATVAMDPLASHSHGDWIGYGCTFLQALMYSASVILSRKLSQSNTVESIVLTSGVACALGGFCVAEFFHQNFVMTQADFLFVRGAGFTGILGVAFFYKALQVAPAAIVSPMH